MSPHRAGWGTTARQLAYYEAQAGEMEVGPERDRLTANVVRLRSRLDGATRCRCCGKKLTDPRSVADRIGPECRLRRTAPPTLAENSAPALASLSTSITPPASEAGNGASAGAEVGRSPQEATCPKS